MRTRRLPGARPSRRGTSERKGYRPEQSKPPGGTLRVTGRRPEGEQRSDAPPLKVPIVWRACRTAMPANGKSVAICPARPVFGYSEPALQRRAGGLQPGQGLAFELRRQHLANPGMIGVPPGDLRLRQQAALNQCRIDRREGERFEAEPFAFAALDPARLDEDEVLDPDAVLAGLIVTGLVGEDHA